MPYDVDDWDYFTDIGTGGAETLTEGHVTAMRRSDGTQVESQWRPLGGRIEPVELTVRPNQRAVSTDEVRRLPLGAVLARSRAALLEAAPLIHDIATITGIEDVDSAFLRAGPQRGQRLGAETLEEVARVYRQAWHEDRSVNEAVRERFTLSKDGAAKRIQAARAAGLLDGVGPKR